LKEILNDKDIEWECRFISLRYRYDLIQLVKSMLLNWVNEKDTIF
jgi:uncharacterized protein (UPF0305 family)